MYAVKHCTILTLLLFFVSSDAYALNSSYDKVGQLREFRGKENLRALGLESFLSISDDQDTVLTTWDDMKAAGITMDMLKDAYQIAYGVRPDTVHLNDELCKKNGWYSRNFLGEISIKNVRKKPKSSVVNERHVANNLDIATNEEVDMTTTLTDTVTATVSRNSAISTTASIKLTAGAFGVDLDAELSTTFSLKNSVQNTKSNTLAVSVGSKVSVPIAPHSKVNVTLMATWISKTADWEIPVHIDPMGLTGVDYHRRVKGAFYKGLRHAAVANPPFQSVIKGHLESTYGTIGNIIIQNM